MNKTIALFITVMLVLVASCIYAYVNIPEPVIVEETEIVKIETTVPRESKPVPFESKTKTKTTSTQTYIYDYPFYGMDEKYINDTSLRKADKVDSTYIVNGDHVIVTTTYVWLNRDGTYRAYAVTGEDPFEEGKRMVHSFTDCSKKKYYYSGSNSNSSDPYNAKDYGYEDDFYDDYYDDFYDYEDAESYWMENH